MARAASEISGFYHFQFVICSERLVDLRIKIDSGRTIYSASFVLSAINTQILVLEDLILRTNASLECSILRQAFPNDYSVQGFCE